MRTRVKTHGVLASNKQSNLRGCKEHGNCRRQRSGGGEGLRPQGSRSLVTRLLHRERGRAIRRRLGNSWTQWASCTPNPEARV